MCSMYIESCYNSEAKKSYEISPFQYSVVLDRLWACKDYVFSEVNTIYSVSNGVVYLNYLEIKLMFQDGKRNEWFCEMFFAYWVFSLNPVLWGDGEQIFSIREKMEKISPNTFFFQLLMKHNFFSYFFVERSLFVEKSSRNVLRVGLMHLLR